MFRFFTPVQAAPVSPNTFQNIRFGQLFNYLTSCPPLKETVLGVFDSAKIVAGGFKNKQIDGFGEKFFAKSIGKNCNRLALVVWEIFKKKTWRR